MTTKVLSRWWIFTLNNPEVTPEELWQRAHAFHASFLAGQLERGESGTLHFQFVTFSKEKVRFSAVKKAFPQAHFEPCKDPDKAVLYCTKEDTRVGEIFRFGDIPLQRNSKTDWDSVFEAAKAGRMDLIPSQIKIKHYGNLKAIAKDHLKGLTTDTVRGIWIQGKPGHGKTHFGRVTLAGENSSYYAKMANKWWDGYQGEPIVVLDDLDKKAECLSHQMKLWADKWSFVAESKGGAVPPMHQVFVVTSNYTIEDIYGADPVLVEALSRRFKFFKLEQLKDGSRLLMDDNGDIFEPEVLAALLRSDFKIK